jgi:hypothetical protein
LFVASFSGNSRNISEKISSPVSVISYIFRFGFPTCLCEFFLKCYESFPKNLRQTIQNFLFVLRYLKNLTMRSEKISSPVSVISYIFRFGFPTCLCVFFVIAPIFSPNRNMYDITETGEEIFSEMLREFPEKLATNNTESLVTFQKKFLLLFLLYRTYFGLVFRLVYVFFSL